MRTADTIIATIVLTLAVSLFSIWFYPSVQDFMDTNRMWNGVAAFSRQFNAVTLTSLDDLSETPPNEIMALIPYREFSGEDLENLYQYVSRGGALLLMDDYGFGNEVLSYLGLDIRFSNKPLLDPLFNYKNQNLPRILDFSESISEAGITAVTLNYATALTNVDNAEVHAWSSAVAFLDVNEDGKLNEGETEGRFPVTATVLLGEGKVVLLADPSLIISSMLERDDNSLFLRQITGYDETKKMQFSLSHLTEMPLDTTKRRLLDFQGILTHPYTLVGVTALIIILVARFTLWRGETLGNSEQNS